jgi:type II secretory pathway component PulM
MARKSPYSHLSRAQRRTDTNRTVRPNWGLYLAKLWRGVDPRTRRAFPGVRAEVSGFGRYGDGQH